VKENVAIRIGTARSRRIEAVMKLKSAGNNHRGAEFIEFL
jgi:hypothetical protein